MKKIKIYGGQNFLPAVFYTETKKPVKGFFYFGAPGEARTHNNGVGGHDFIQLDYECMSPQTPLRALRYRKAQVRYVAALTKIIIAQSS